MVERSTNQIDTRSQAQAMETTDQWKKIKAGRIKEFVKKYSSVVPKDLQDLDHARLHTIPEILKSRKDTGDAYLEKSEVVQLVEWKLYAICQKKGVY